MSSSLSSDKVTIEILTDYLFPKSLESLRNLKIAIESSLLPFQCNIHPYLLSSEDLESIASHPDKTRITESSASSASINAHRLMALVQQRFPGAQLELAIRILSAFVEERKDISAVGVLLDICKEIPSLSLSIVTPFLEDGKLALEDVLDIAKENEGQQGVPFVVMGLENDKRRKIIFSGLQSIDTFTEAIKNLSSEVHRPKKEA